MKLGVEQKNKIFAFIFIFIISIYTATMIHEIGHAISSIFLGCNYPNPSVFITIHGFTWCNFPEGWYDSLALSNLNIFTLFGPLFVSLMGIIFFIFYRKLNYIRKHWVLAFIFYCLAFNFLLNGFLQFILSGDHSILVTSGTNPIFLWIIGGFLLLILLYHTIKFKELMKLTEPKMKEKIANKLRNWFIALFVIICAVYLILPLI